MSVPTRAPDPPTLARAITPSLLLVLVVGNVLGAGIYAVVGEVAGETGGLSWLAFVVAFGTAGISALTLCELVTKYPGASGVVLYVDRAFRQPALSLTVGLMILASGLTSAATAARAFGGQYLEAFVDLDVTLAAATFVIALSALNWWGIVESLRANVLMTILEIGGLLLVVAAALALISQGDGDLARPFSPAGSGDDLVPLALLGGAAVAFFSFLGFEDVANVSEEVRDPHRAYPRALFGGLAVTGLLYIGVVFLTVSAVPPASLVDSSAPLLVVVDESPLGAPTRLFAAIALVAVANTALANLVMSSRLVYGLSSRHMIPATFSRIDARRSTPWVAVLAVATLAVALTTTGDLGGLARTTVLLLLAVLTLMNLSAIRLRRDLVTHRHFVAPRWAPWLGAVTCLALIVDQVVGGEPRDLIRAAVIVGCGVALSLITRPGRAPSRRAAVDVPEQQREPAQGDDHHHPLPDTGQLGHDEDEPGAAQRDRR